MIYSPRSLLFLLCFALPRWKIVQDELGEFKKNNPNADDAKIHSKLNELANANGGQKAPVLLEIACEWMMPDPLHLDTNFTKKWALKHDLAANNIDIEHSKTDPEYGIGPVQAALHEGMVKAGHKRYVTRLQNRKSRDENKQKETEIRFDGHSAIQLYRSFHLYNDALEHSNETDLEMSRRIKLRAEMLLQSRMSDAYSRYLMSGATAANLKKAGHILHNIWRIEGDSMGLNDTTITHALPAINEKWFKYMRVGDGTQSLSPGITGSNQGSEHKHADTKDRSKSQTSGRVGWAKKILLDELLRKFATIHHPEAHPLGKQLKSTSTYRYPSEADMEKNYENCCTSCLRPFTDEQPAAHPFCIIVRFRVEGTELISRNHRSLAFK